MADTFSLPYHSHPRIIFIGGLSMSAAEQGRRADPVITEIVRNGVIAVTEEMKTNLMRTAYNHIIYEALDFTTGLFNAKGETVSIGLACPCLSVAWRRP